MADEKAPPEEDKNSFSSFIFAMIVIVATALFVAQYFPQDENEPLESSEGLSSRTFLIQDYDREDQDRIIGGTGNILGGAFERLFPADEIVQGSKIGNVENVEVRADPAGSILGIQKLGAIGKVIGGPADAFGERWWNIDYENAPDGWVSEAGITTRLWQTGFLGFWPSFWGWIKMIGYTLAVLILLMIIYVRLVREKVPLYYPKEIEESSEEGPMVASVTPPKQNERWLKITRFLESRNPSDWKQAIIEADIILEEMLEKMGYAGPAISDKLKQVEKADFKTLDEAWEAHKVRNRIAHGGMKFKLSHNEAERIIGLYKKVFEEFFYI